jgi:hypothetical protein
LAPIGYANENTPVVGVAMGPGDRGPLALHVLLREEVPEFLAALAGLAWLEPFEIQRLVIGDTRAIARPTLGGDSLGEGVHGGRSGTFGCLVEDPMGDPYLVSCNHVIAGLNSRKRGIDLVWQPSSSDGGGPRSQIGVLHDFAPIVFGGTTPNSIDAALVKPDDARDASSGIRSLGPVNGTLSPIPYRLKVHKMGWKTNLTDGTFLYRTNFIHKYATAGDALFENQLGIVGSRQAFSDDGDSGAMVLTDTGEAVGLLFVDAPDISMSFANPARDVFDYFGVTPV